MCFASPVQMARFSFAVRLCKTIETTHRLSACPLAAWLQAPIILVGKVLQQLETLSAPVIKGIATLIMSVSCKWKQCHSELHMPFVDELSCRLQLLLAISLIIHQLLCTCHYNPIQQHSTVTSAAIRKITSTWSWFRFAVRLGILLYSALCGIDSRGCCELRPAVMTAESHELCFILNKDTVTAWRMRCCHSWQCVCRRLPSCQSQQSQ